MAVAGVKDAEKRSFLHTAACVMREAVADNDEVELARLGALTRCLLQVMAVP